MPWGWRGRGWRKGFCWYLLSQGITRIRIGNQEIPVVPGMGIGRMIAMNYFLGSTTDVQTVSANEKVENEIERLRKEKEELEKRLKELEEKIREIERKNLL